MRLLVVCGGAWASWCARGAGAEPYLVKDLAPGTSGSYPGDLTVVGDLCFFSANDPAHGRELWASDGTPECTYLVKDISPGEASSDPFTFRVVDDRAVFLTLVPGISWGLWATDGTAAGTRRVSDRLDQYFRLDLAATLAAGGRLLLPSFHWDPSPFGHWELWVTDGTPAGTVQLRPDLGWPQKRCGDGGGCMSPWYNLAAFRGRVYFPARDERGEELWVSDGTPAGTSLLIDIAPGPDSSAPGNLVARGDRLFFWCRGELWVSDGTAVGTLRFRELVGQPESWQAGDLSCYGFGYFELPASLGSRWIFPVGGEVWVSDGTPGRTTPHPALAGSGPCPLRFATVGARIVVTMGDGDVLAAQDSPDAAVEVLPLPWRGSLFDHQNPGFTPFQDWLVLEIPERGVWATDGTEAGTSLLSDLLGMPSISRPGVPVVLGDRALVAAEDDESGRELWFLPLGGQAEPRFRRGDTNTDATLDLSDAVATLGFLFLGAAAPGCLDAADANDSGAVDLSDAVFTLEFLFLGTAPPPEPSGACGVDPTEDALHCAGSKDCP